MQSKNAHMANHLMYAWTNIRVAMVSSHPVMSQNEVNDNVMEEQYNMDNIEQVYKVVVAKYIVEREISGS